jgi:hypothetical protein
MEKKKAILLSFVLLVGAFLNASQMYVVGEVFTQTW